MLGAGRECGFSSSAALRWLLSPVFGGYLMKRQPVRIAWALSVCVTTGTVAPVAFAQLPAGDLRLWLKGDSLSLAEDAPVKQWVDSSGNGTIFEPRTVSNPN